MQCHKCPYNGKRSEMCFKCRDTLSTPQNSGRTFVSLDGGYGENIAATEGLRVEHGSRLAVEPCCEDAVRKMLAVIMSLDDGQLSLFMGLMRGESLRGYARRVGIGKSTACKMLRLMVGGHPELGFLRRMVNNA